MTTVRSQSPVARQTTGLDPLQETRNTPQPQPVTQPQTTAPAEAPRERADAGTVADARRAAVAAGAAVGARIGAALGTAGQALGASAGAAAALAEGQAGGAVGGAAAGAGTASNTGGVGDVRAATANMTEAQKYDYYRNVIQQNGGQFNDAPGARNLLAVRNPTDTNANGGRGVYDDQFAMVWRDRQGNPHVREYRGNTEPSGQYEGREGEDANRDGSRDLGRLRPGFYEFENNGQFLGRQSLRMRGDAIVDRDTNHDGQFNDGATTRGGNSMLIHRGGEDGNPRGTWSAGCQTMPSSEYDRFMRDLTDGGRSPARLGYTLVNR